MNTKKILSLIFCFSIIGNHSFSQKILVLPLEEAYTKQEIITAKDFIESFIYIPLETSPQCLIGANPNIILTDNYIIITDQKQCLAFNKDNGKFICQIGHYGRDPGGFQSSQGFYNEFSKSFYFLGWNKNLIKFSLDGKEIGSIRIPRYNESFTDTFLPEKYTYIAENSFACNILNFNGIQNSLLMIFDEKGNEIKTIPNYNVTKEHKPVISTGEMNFFHYNGKLFFNEIFNDTIFNLQLGKVVPYIILKREKYRITRENKGLPAEKIWTRSFFESDKYITFNFFGGHFDTYFALYDKSTLKLRVCKLGAGIKNNINSFIPFIPSEIFHEELVGLSQPLDIANWVEANKEVIKSLPQELKKIISVGPTDNPVVVIARLRK
jgi:hypothetical protein